MIREDERWEADKPLGRCQCQRLFHKPRPQKAAKSCIPKQHGKNRIFCSRDLGLFQDYSQVSICGFWGRSFLSSLPCSHRALAWKTPSPAPGGPELALSIPYHHGLTHLLFAETAAAQQLIPHLAPHLKPIPLKTQQLVVSICPLTEPKYLTYFPPGTQWPEVRGRTGSLVRRSDYHQGRANLFCL